MKNIFIFDVESDGLWGNGFCVAAIVANTKGEILDKFSLRADIEISSNWVKENVLQRIREIECCEDLKTLRDRFYEFYMKHKETCDIYSDCNFPVETNFLRVVAIDDLKNREWNMPFPLLDISSIKDSNINRNKFYLKKNSSWITGDFANRRLKEHNPIDDCVASLCLLLDKKIYYAR